MVDAHLYSINEASQIQRGAALCPRTHSYASLGALKCHGSLFVIAILLDPSYSPGLCAQKFLYV